MPTPERVADTTCHTGEGPLWHPDRETLFYLDIPNGLLYEYDPGVNEYELVYETDVIGGFTVQADGRLLLFGAAGRVSVWDPETGAVERVVIEDRRSRGPRLRGDDAH